MVDGSRFTQFLVQLEGVALNFAWAFGISYVAFKLIDTMNIGGGMRVEEKAEVSGLNVSEHQTQLGTGEVVNALRKLSEGRADLAHRLDETAGDESGELARYYNKVMNELIDGIAYGVKELSETTSELGDISTGLSNHAAGTTEQAAQAARETETVEANITEMEQSAHEVRECASVIHDSASQMNARVETARGKAEEIAAAVDFLVGPEGAYVTGQTLIVDGGLSL